MSDVTYRRTPARYGVGECEGYYEAMAAKGWLLKRRGINFDRYRRGEPQDLQYRIECAERSLDFGFEPLSEEILQLYAERGWTLAAHDKEIYVFCALQGSEIPQIDNQCARLTDMLNSARKGYWGKVISVAVWVCFLFIQASVIPLGVNILAEWDFPIFLVLTFWVLALWKGIHGVVMLHRLSRQLKNEGTFDRDAARKNRHRVHRTVTAVLSGMGVICLLGWGVEALLSEKAELPATAEHLPYLLAEDVFSAQRDSADELDIPHYETNYVNYTPTLIAPVQYHTAEDFNLDGDSSGWIYQDVYTTWNPELAVRMAWLLTKSSVLIKPTDFTQVDIDGLDLALSGGIELIAVKGNTVVHCICGCSEGQYHAQQLLEAYAQKLA